MMRKKSQSKKNKAWTNEDKDELIELLKEEKRPREIAKIMGRTAPAISAMIYVMRKESKTEPVQEELIIE